VLQEALSNVLRHSGATKAKVRLSVLHGRVHLEIQDYGQGFPSGEGKPRGLGLVAMRERAAILDGELTITRPREGGTLVALDAPMTSAENSS
jgi:signal transduction histidine kinase